MASSVEPWREQRELYLRSHLQRPNGRTLCTLPGEQETFPTFSPLGKHVRWSSANADGDRWRVTGTTQARPAGEGYSHALGLTHHSASAAERAKQVLRNGISDMNYLRFGRQNNRRLASGAAGPGQLAVR
eukprot:scaffold14375_cov133-Isochrysis_galbana.AAC.8